MGLKSVKAAPFALWAVQAVLDAANCIFKIQPFKLVLRIIDMAPAASSPRYQLAPAGRRQASCWVPIVTGSVLVGVHCWWWWTVTRTETPDCTSCLSCPSGHCSSVLYRYSARGSDVLGRSPGRTTALCCPYVRCPWCRARSARPGQAAGALDQPRPQVWTSV